MSDPGSSVSIFDTANFIAAGALFLALIVFIYQIRTTNLENQHQKSRFALDSVLEGLEHAYNLLKDGSNSRVDWVAAARAIARSQSLASHITEKVHQDAISIHIDKYRILFSEILGFDNPQKTASFFYGANSTTTNIDDAAKESSKRKGSQPKLDNIPESALWLVFMAARFPEDYEDPLTTKHGFNDEFLDNSINMVLYPALHQYLKHRRKYISIGGKLIERKRDKAT